VELGRPLRDGIRVRQARCRALVHERTDGCGKGCPERSRFVRADV